MADNKTFRLRVIAPERLFYEGDVDMAELNTTEGEIGILPEHIPLTTIVAPGVLKITKGEEIKEAALLEGFMEVKKDSVTILAESCEWPEEIDGARANEARIRAERRLAEHSPETDIARAEAALRRALVRLSLVEEH